MIVAAIILLVLAAGAAVVGYVSGRRGRAMAETSTNACGALGTGPCELVATSAAGPTGLLTAPFSGTPCVWHRSVVTHIHKERVRDADGDSRMETQHDIISDNRSETPFLLRDETGSVAVDPKGADVDRPEKVFDVIEKERPDVEALGDGILGKLATLATAFDDSRYQREEWVLRPDTQLYVLAEAADVMGTIRVHEPKRGRFLISTRSEAELTAASERWTLIGWAAAAVLGLAGVGLLVAGLG